MAHSTWNFCEYSEKETRNCFNKQFCYIVHFWWGNIQYVLRVPSTEMEVVSMLKAVIFEAASIKVFAIWVLLGTDVDANPRPNSLMIDPFLQKQWPKNMVVFKWSYDQYSGDSVNITTTELLPEWIHCDEAEWRIGSSVEWFKLQKYKQTICKYMNVMHITSTNSQILQKIWWKKLQLHIDLWWT